MGFLKSLFGGNKPVSSPIHEKEMTGTEYSIGAMTYQIGHSPSIETQQGIQSEDSRARFRWTEHKQMEFLAQFFKEKFVFDGKVESMVIWQFLVERDLTGRIEIALYAETFSEIQDHYQKWGENPTSVGTLTLQFLNGKPLVKVLKLIAEPGAPDRWTNQNKSA